MLLLTAATGVLAAAGVQIRRQIVVAAVRAAVQLAAIGAVLGLVFRFPGAAAIVLAVMLITATHTAGRRLRDFTGASRAVFLSSLAGALCTLLIAFGTGAVAFRAGARGAVPPAPVIAGSWLLAAGWLTLLPLIAASQPAAEAQPSSPGGAAPVPEQPAA